MIDKTIKITDMSVSVGKRDSKGRIVTPELLLDMMKTYRIDHVVAYHDYACLEHKSGNALMKKIADESDGKIGLCVNIDPLLGADNLPGEGSLSARLSAIGAECMRIFPTLDRVTFHPFYLGEIFEAANELSMPIIIDDTFSVSSPAQFFAMIPEISKQYPKAKFVVIRYGICGSRHIFPIVKNCKNVYFTIEKLLDCMQLEEIFEITGNCDNLLFGSCFPEVPPAGALGTAFYADIPQCEREKILYKNWEAIRYGNN